MFDLIIAGYRTLFLLIAGLTGEGWAIVVLSFLCSLLMIPLMRAVAGIVVRETEYQNVILPQIAAIKEKYASDIDRNMRIQALYSRYSYSPVSAVKKVLPLFVQIPFLLLTYFMLKGTSQLSGVSFLFLKDLGAADALLNGVNLLPFVMTGVNLITVFATPGFTRRDMTQAIGIALLFLVMLYTAPSALLLYWTLNNAITCVRTLVVNRFEGMILLLKRLCLFRKLPEACAYCFTWRNIQLFSLTMFLLGTYFSWVLFFSSDIKTSHTYGVSKYGLVFASLLVVLIVVVKIFGFFLLKALRYCLESIIVFIRVLRSDGYWLILPVSFAIHYSFSSAALSLPWSSVLMMVFHLTYPCVALAMVLIFLFRNFLRTEVLLKLSVAFFVGVYVIPMVSIEGNGFRGVQTNIWLRLFIVTTAVTLFLLIKKKMMGVVLSGLFITVVIFNACTQSSFSQEKKDSKFGHDRLNAVVGADVHCVKSNNVYFLVWDSYAHRTLMDGLRVNYDSSIYDKLQNSGFKIYDGYTTDWNTVGSMDAAFALIQRVAKTKRGTISGDNIFSDFLRASGYHTSYLLCSFVMPEITERKPGDFYFPTQKEMANKDNVLRECIFNGMMTQNPNKFNSYSHKDWLDVYYNVMRNRKPFRQFIYAHSSVPDHAPWYSEYRKSDEIEKKMYEKRLFEANKEIEKTLDLIKDDKDSIVIIASDHGPSLMLPKSAGRDARHLLDHHGILLAVRWPKDYRQCLEVGCLQNLLLEVMIYLSGNTDLAKFEREGETISMPSPISTPFGLVKRGKMESGRHKGMSLSEAAAIDFIERGVSLSRIVDLSKTDLSNAELLDSGKGLLIKCTGVLDRKWDEKRVDEFIARKKYVGAKFKIKNIHQYQRLVFDGKKESSNGQPTIVMSVDGKSWLLLCLTYSEIDNEWHTYEVLLPDFEGDAEIILNGGYTDMSGSMNSCYLFRNVKLCK